MPSGSDHVTVTSRKGWRMVLNVVFNAESPPLRSDSGCADMVDSLEDQLCNASASGNLADVKRLLQNGADVNGFNKFNRTALQVSVTDFQMCIGLFVLACN